MSYIEIDDDDDDIVVDTEPQKKLSKEEQARKVIKQGLVDTQKIVSLLDKNLLYDEEGNIIE